MGVGVLPTACITKNIFLFPKYRPFVLRHALRQHSVQDVPEPAFALRAHAYRYPGAGSYFQSPALVPNELGVRDAMPPWEAILVGVVFEKGITVTVHEIGRKVFPKAAFYSCPKSNPRPPRRAALGSASAFARWAAADSSRSLSSGGVTRRVASPATTNHRFRVRPI